MRKYTVLIREAKGCGAGYWAEVEQLPGCYAFSDNLGRLAQDVQEAVEQHVSKLRASGSQLPDGVGEAGMSDTWEVQSPLDPDRAYTALAHRDEDGYWADVKELPGVVATGETIEALRKDVSAAVEAHLVALRALGDEIPAGAAYAGPAIRSWQLAVAD
jgi:predicted RNase H-like HicB family nuclease